jgi:uncharacterized DUF497 family protein
MRFEWDPLKAAANVKKHGVDLADAVSVLYDEFAITLPDDHAEEERFVTMGTDAVGRVLVIAYTWRGECIRLISARRATRRERKLYEGHR